MGRCSYSNRYTVEDCLKFSIKGVNAKTLSKIKSPIALLVKWKNGNTVKLIISSDSITIKYTIKDTPFAYNIPLSTIPCLRGEKVYMHCPNRECNSRVLTLYLAPGTKYFLCRKCHNLSYRSQKEHNKTLDKYKQFGRNAQLVYLHDKLNKLLNLD